MDQDPLQRIVDAVTQQTICGETTAGHRGKLSNGEDPVDRLGCGYVDAAQKGDVLQPQVQCLHTTNITYPRGKDCICKVQRSLCFNAWLCLIRAFVNPCMYVLMACVTATGSVPDYQKHLAPQGKNYL